MTRVVIPVTTRSVAIPRAFAVRSAGLKSALILSIGSRVEIDASDDLEKITGVGGQAAKL